MRKSYVCVCVSVCERLVCERVVGEGVVSERAVCERVARAVLALDQVMCKSAACEVPWRRYENNKVTRR